MAAIPIHNIKVLITLMVQIRMMSFGCGFQMAITDADGDQATADIIVDVHDSAPTLGG